jgi:hypothetical protein
MFRTTITIAVASAALAAAPAGAATRRPPVRKPVCNLVTDATGDAAFPVAQQQQPLLDITSADVASDAKQITAVIRVNGPGTADALLNYRVSLRFSPPGAPTPLYLAYAYDRVSGESPEWGTYNPTSGVYDRKSASTDVLKTAHVGNEFHVTVLTSALTGFKVAPGLKLAGLVAESRAWSAAYYGQHNVILEKQVDTADSKATYVTGWPSCAKVGA